MQRVRPFSHQRPLSADRAAVVAALVVVYSTLAGRTMGLSTEVKFIPTTLSTLRLRAQELMSRGGEQAGSTHPPTRRPKPYARLGLRGQRACPTNAFSKKIENHTAAVTPQLSLAIPARLVATVISVREDAGGFRKPGDPLRDISTPPAPLLTDLKPGSGAPAGSQAALGHAEHPASRGAGRAEILSRQGLARTWRSLQCLAFRHEGVDRGAGHRSGSRGSIGSGRRRGTPPLRPLRIEEAGPNGVCARRPSPMGRPHHACHRYLAWHTGCL